MKLFQLLQTVALHSVLYETSDYKLRHIFRWYSEKFHTPLHMVEELPIEDVLTAYFECNYEGLNDDERKDEKILKEIEHLLETEDERKERERREQNEQFKEEDSEEKFLKEAERLEMLKRGKESKDKSITGDVVPQKDPKTSITEIEPDIEMKFISDEELEQALTKDWSLFGDDE